VEGSGEHRTENEEAPFFHRFGPAWWSAIAGVIGAIAAVLALVIPNDDNDPQPSGPSPAPESQVQVDPREVEREAQKAASEQVADFGIFYEPDYFTADCALLSATAANEVWDCSILSGQCSGVVTLTFQAAGVESTEPSVGCRE
jgi:hypothetical protein